MPSLLIAAVLLRAAFFKITSEYAESAVKRSALSGLLGERALRAYQALGVVEGIVAVALLTALPVPVLRVPAGIAATGLTAGFLGYLAYSRLKTPDSSCGCLGAKPVPVTWRALTRGVLLLGLSVLVLVDNGFRPLPLVAGGLAIVALSAELDDYWLMPLRRLKVRLTHPLSPREAFRVPLDSTVEQLQNSGPYRQLAPSLRSDVREFWDEQEWRMVVYSATYDGREASAVFAVPRLRYAPADVRAAVVDDADDRVLVSVG